MFSLSVSFRVIIHVWLKNIHARTRVYYYYYIYMVRVFVIYCTGHVFKIIIKNTRTHTC